MGITIKPADIGNFKSVEQSRAYNSAMGIKKEFEEIAQNVMKCDDVVNLDINSPNKGNVLVDEAKLRSLGVCSGKVIYNNETKEPEAVDMEIHKTGEYDKGTFRNDNHYKLEEVDNKQVYERDTCTHWRADWQQGTKTYKEKVVIDKSTGEMEYLLTPGKSFSAMTNPWT